MVFFLIIMIFVWLLLSFILQDKTPPHLLVEVPNRVAANREFRLKVSADDAVTYRITYGDLALEVPLPYISLNVKALEGSNLLSISAIDNSGNISIETVNLYGEPLLPPELNVPAALIPGEPFAIIVSLPEAVEIQDVTVMVAGVTQTLTVFTDTTLALGSVPLDTEAQLIPISVTITDNYGRISTAERQLQVLEYPQEIEELYMTNSQLSVVTTEGRELEVEVLNEANEMMNETPMPFWQESFLLPISGKVTSGFGSLRRYAMGGHINFHNGEDIAAPTGTPIHATNDGIVLIADFFPIKGGFTVINHGAGLYSSYLHQSSISVQVNQKVKRGDVIGAVGSTGLSTGPHLHWEMRLRSNATNPLSWVGKVLP